MVVALLGSGKAHRLGQFLPAAVVFDDGLRHRLALGDVHQAVR
jgi:hypothetical protein